MNAVEKEDYRDAHLLRRSRISLASGDRYGAIAHMRRLLELYPFAGQVVWFYSQIVKQEDVVTFLSDVNTAMARLHPHEQPLDFLVAAGRVAGAEAITRKRFNKGLNRDCAPLGTRATQDNCYAWYNALAGRALHSSLKRIDRALQETGSRAEFLDTKAVLHLSLEQYELAHKAAVHAAQLAPEDIYMLWQVDFTKGLLDAHHH
jgi:tetratricopeptide (TPR) repeat protein